MRGTSSCTSRCPAAPQLGDEGAANHTRFATGANAPGVELFVYGRSGFATAAAEPRRFVARQTREACESIARRHGLAAARTLFAQQHPDAIDAGVFHNDVIAVGSGTVLFCHERAYVAQEALLRRRSQSGSARRSRRSWCRSAR